MGVATIFWAVVLLGSAALLAWAYAGYAVWVIMQARRAGGQQRPAMDGFNPAVSLVIAARNEAKNITAKLQSLLALPGGLLREVIVVCDHCTDDTPALVQRLGDARVKCVRNDSGPSGKAAALNLGVAAATGDLILFNDVRQTLDDHALPHLAAWFVNAENGAVSGALNIQSSTAGTGQGLDAYWTLEKRIRHAESVLHSSVGCTGAIYMIRRELYQPIPADTILDDVVIPMQIAEQGWRVRFDDAALAFDPQPLAGPQEARRKTRTLAGNFQMLARYPHWLLPWGHHLWFDLISHKYLRILSPLLLLLCLVATAILAHWLPFRLLLGAELMMLLLGTLGLLLPKVRFKALAIPAAFLMLQLSVVKGFLFWMRTQQRGLEGWK